MKPTRCFLALAPCVLAMAAQGAISIPAADSGAFPTVLPGTPAIFAPIPEPVPCTPLRVTPAANSQGNFSNPLVSVAYTAAQAKRCAAVTLLDRAGNAVATTVRHQNEWPNPLGGVAGTVTVAPVSDLSAGAAYQIHLAGAPVGTFSTAATASQRGRAVAVTDQPVVFSDLPKTAQLNVATINKLLPTLLKDALPNKAVQLLAESALRTEAPNLAQPRARYGARVKKLTYSSSRADGTPIVLSGLLVYPENPDGSAFNYNGVPTVIGQHGTIRTKKTAPSQADTVEVVVGLLTAGKGHVYFAPDLIGLGDTVEQPQAYLLAQDTASASEDMLLAVRNYFAEQFDGAQLSRDLRIFGVSQGGYSAMAALPSLSALADVKALYAGEGPFNLFRTLQSPILTLAGAPRDAYARYENLDFVPGHLSSIMQGMRAYEGLAYNDNDVFIPDGGLQPRFIADFSQKKFPVLFAHMGVNTLLDGDLTYTAPQAKVVLFHYSKDSLVPAQNSSDMLGFLHNGRHSLASVNRGDCYEHSVFVKLFLTLGKSVEKTHTVCALYTTDRFIGEL
jgi:hypothetical protein